MKAIIVQWRDDTPQIHPSNAATNTQVNPGLPNSPVMTDWGIRQLQPKYAGVIS